MNKINLLVSLGDKNRRVKDRRNEPRRVVEHAFGSEKWIQVIRSSYVFWPKEEQRIQERREETRRIAERRTERRVGQEKQRFEAFRKQTLKRPRQNQTLTEEERQMLRDLYH